MKVMIQKQPVHCLSIPRILKTALNTLSNKQFPTAFLTIMVKKLIKVKLSKRKIC